MSRRYIIPKEQDVGIIACGMQTTYFIACQDLKAAGQRKARDPSALPTSIGGSIVSYEVEGHGTLERKIFEVLQHRAGKRS